MKCISDLFSEGKVDVTITKVGNGGFAIHLNASSYNATYYKWEMKRRGGLVYFYSSLTNITSQKNLLLRSQRIET